MKQVSNKMHRDRRIGDESTNRNPLHDFELVVKPAFGLHTNLLVVYRPDPSALKHLRHLEAPIVSPNERTQQECQ